MPDPTASVIIATFSSALGIFILTATARTLIGKKAEPLPEISPPPPYSDQPSPDAPPPRLEINSPVLDETSPYQAPPAIDPSPPIPVGRVPIWFYRPLDLLGLGLIYLVFFSLVVASVSASGKEEASLSAGGLIASIAFQFVCVGIVTAFVISRVRPIEWLGLRWPGWRWIFLIAPGTVLGMWLFFGGLQASGFMRWIESFGVEAVQDTVKILQDSKDPTILGLMIFAAVVAAPFCEEIVFRGYLYPAAKRFAGPWVACICSALIFAAAHGSLAALLPLFVFGCVLVFIYEKTGSLWASIGVHLCFNGATVLVQMAARYYDVSLDSVP